MARVIKVNVSTGWANGDHNEEHELPGNWDSLTEDQKGECLNEIAMDFLYECCESSAWVEEG